MVSRTASTNFAWALGILAGPALGGFLYEQVGFTTLMWTWATAVLVITGLLARAGHQVTRSTAPTGAL